MKKKNKRSLSQIFTKFSAVVIKFTGSPAAFFIALLAIVIWAACGPIAQFNDTWQLIINTSTTIITFLMVFLIQQSQNRDTLAMQLKLNELIASSKDASNHLIDIEDLTEEELEVLKKYYIKLAKLVKEEQDIRTAHSLGEAENTHKEKHNK
jgi:low affinity Fe/Cu permease